MPHSDRLLNYPLFVLGLHSRSSAPRAVWKRLQGVRIGLWLLTASNIGFLALAWMGIVKPSEPMQSWHWIVPPLTVLAFVTGPRVVNSQLRRKVREAGGRVCDQCSYSLRGLPDDSRCPECGRPYRYETMRSTWVHWFGTKLESGWH